MTRVSSPPRRRHRRPEPRRSRRPIRRAPDRPADPWGSLPPLPPTRAAAHAGSSPSASRSPSCSRGLVGVVIRRSDDGPEPPRRVGPAGRRPGRLRRGRARPRLRPPRARRLPHPRRVHRRATTEDDGGPEEEERAEYERVRRAAAALGVASGELDLYEAFNSVVDSGTLAFYDPTDERIRVRGTEMTRRPRGHARPRAHPRPAGPALRPRAAARRELDSGAADRVPRAGRGRRPAGRERLHRGGAHRGRAGRVRRGVRRGAGRQRGGHRATCPPFIEARFGAPYAARPALRHHAVQPGRQRRRRRRVRASRPTPRSTCFDPASFLADEGADGRSTSTSPTTPRSSRRDPSAPRPGTCSSPSGSTRRSPSRPPSDGTATPSRPTRRTARCACRRCSSATPTPTRRRWPPRLDDWEARHGRRAGRGHRGRRPPRHRGVRSRRGRRPRAHGPLRDVAVPPEPVGLPRRRRRHRARPRARAAATPRAVLDDLTYEEIIDPEAHAFAGDAFQQTLDDAFDACAG